MFKNSFIILALSAIVFLSGLTTGLLSSKNKYGELSDVFQAKVMETQEQIRHTEFINKKLKITFETVEARNKELKSKAEIIQSKEQEIAHLTLALAQETNAAKKEHLSELLQQKRKELNELRRKYDEKNKEIISLNKELGEVNRLLKLNSVKIAETQEQYALEEKTNRETKKEIQKIKSKASEQIKYYELGGIEEAKADSMQGLKNRWEKEDIYIKAFNYYIKAQSINNAERVASKVKNKKIRKEMEDVLISHKEQNIDY